MARDIWNEITVELELALLEVRTSGSVAWQGLSEAFLLPGDAIVALLSEHVPAVAGKSALDLATHGEAYAVGFSILAWLCLLLAILRCLQSAGRSLIGGYYAARRAAAWTARFPRSLRLRLSAPVGALRRRRLAGSCYSEEFRIDSLQVSVMNAQRRLPPGHVATAVDIAGDLGLRPEPVEHALEGLKKLHLVQVAFGTCEGYPGYMLTRPGEIFLSTCAANTKRAPDIGPDIRNSIRIIRPGPVPAVR